MDNIKERLDTLKANMQEDDFLHGKGLSNEVNIRIFCYDPKDELVVQDFVERVKTEKLRCNVVEVNLYKTMIRILEEKNLLGKIPMQEEKKGKLGLANALKPTMESKAFVAKLKNYISINDGDILTVTGVGDVFPFLRVHSLLEALQPAFPDGPILVFYPGRFDGRSLSLFNELESNPYYRAFREVAK